MSNYLKDLIQDARLELTEFYTTELVNKLNTKQVAQLHDYHFDSVCYLLPEQMIQYEDEFERFLNDLVCEYSITNFYKPSLSI